MPTASAICESLQSPGPGGLFRGSTFDIAADLRYRVLKRSTMLLNIHALSSSRQTILSESFEAHPGVSWEEFPLETGENRYIRLDTGDVDSLSIRYRVRVETRTQMIGHDEIREVPVSRIDRTAIPYLFPSRYCQSDRIGRLADKLFDGIADPYDKAVAVADWIHDNIDYLSGSTDSATSAFDTVTQRAGVCRDFAHLGIAMCRAMSIPARYFTGYACGMEPPDFHACFEACVGNRWFIFDPTRRAPLNGLVRIAHGRDAADASLATIFGAMQMESLEVSCTSEDFQPLAAEDLAHHAILSQS